MAFNKITVLNILHDNDNLQDAIMEIENLSDKKQKNYIMDSQNNPFAVFCYYHKQWELIEETDYGIKASTKTGLNTMCKLGTRKWTAQQKTSVKDKSDLLVKLMDNEMKSEEIKQLNDDIDRKQKLIDLEGSIGYSLGEVKLRLNDHDKLI